MNKPIASNAPDPGKTLLHEQAAHEKRHWIRLTSMCNNLCTFCLDTMAHNGTITADSEVKARIIEGRRKGASRLILSGGEPTIHPQFIKFVKLGRLAGYSKVQTVTNGRMFSYPEFLTRSLDAGLDEITFSIHGHNAKVHDALVGVPGAFDEEVEGLRLALEDGRPIINIDVCLNKGNIRKLPELLDRFIGMGVKEYDLLHLIPFGMAWDEKHRNSLVYDIDEAFPYIQHALKISERPDVHIWFNRFPPPYLEGYEHLIQDPYKLNDEARGRYEEFELWITRDMPISCREPERCHRCYLKHFCDTLEESTRRVREHDYDAYRVRTETDAEPLEAPAAFPVLWLTTENMESARKLFHVSPSPLVLELVDWTGFVDALQGNELDGRPVERVICRDPQAMNDLLASPAGFEVTALLNVDMAAWLLESLPGGHPRLRITLPNYEKITEGIAELPDLPAFFAAWSGEARIENIPQCISGVAPIPRLHTLDSDALRKQDPDYQNLSTGDTGGRTSILKELDTALTVGDPAKLRYLNAKLGQLNPVVDGAKLELFGYSRDYIRTHYYSKSLRCRSCIHFDTCEGLHITTIRAKGYGILNPITAEDAAE